MAERLERQEVRDNLARYIRDAIRTIEEEKLHEQRPEWWQGYKDSHHVILEWLKRDAEEE